MLKNEKNFIKETNLLQDAIHHNAVKHGWWEDFNTDKFEKEIGSKLALIHSEVSEALEAVRNDFPKSDKVEGLSNFEEELADAVIRIFDLAGALHINLASAIVAKHEYNKTRPYKHGGKAI